MTARIDYFQQSPALFKKYLEFSLQCKDSRIEAGIHHLVSLRASQINGCGFCVDMHVKQAALAGERELRLHHVAIWRESSLFSARERAALEWTEALTVLAPHGVDDATYERVRAEFSEQELSDLSFAVMNINGWNRINVALRSVPGSKDVAFGLSKAQLR